MTVPTKVIMVPSMLKHFLPFLFCAAALAQTPVNNINPCVQQGCYYAGSSATVSASGTTTLTIQQPTTGARQVSFVGAVVQCPGQTFTVSQAQNGTAATATAGTAVSLIPTTTAAAALVFTASNVGAGTGVAPVITYTSGSVATLELSQRTMGLSGGTNNYSITLTNTGSSSCTGTIGIYWSERI